MYIDSNRLVLLDINSFRATSLLTMKYYIMERERLYFSFRYAVVLCEARIDYNTCTGIAYIATLKMGVGWGVGAENSFFSGTLYNFQKREGRG